MHARIADTRIKEGGGTCRRLKAVSTAGRSVEPDWVVRCALSRVMLDYALQFRMLANDAPMALFAFVGGWQVIRDRG